MALYIQNGPTAQTWGVLGICLGIMLIVYVLTRRRVRRRRLVAIELRLESAWQDVKASLGFAASRRTVGLAGTFQGGLQTGPQGRVLSMHPIGEEVKVMAIGVGAATEAAGLPEDTAQQTEISCDI